MKYLIIGLLLLLAGCIIQAGRGNEVNTQRRVDTEPLIRIDTTKTDIHGEFEQEESNEESKDSIEITNEGL